MNPAQDNSVGLPQKSNSFQLLRIHYLDEKFLRYGARPATCMAKIIAEELDMSPAGIDSSQFKQAPFVNCLKRTISTRKNLFLFIDLKGYVEWHEVDCLLQAIIELVSFEPLLRLALVVQTNSKWHKAGRHFPSIVNSDPKVLREFVINIYEPRLLNPILLIDERCAEDTLALLMELQKKMNQ